MKPIKINPQIINKSQIKLSKPVWHKCKNIETFDVFEPFDVKNQVLEKLNVSIESRLNIAGKYRIMVKNMQKKELGDEVFTLQNKGQTICGNRITVEDEYRATLKRPKYNIGELLRLISVMTMKKNNIDSIKIYSAKSAVYFHSKYKFEPNIKDHYELKEALETLIDDNAPAFKDLSQKAKELYAKFPRSCWIINPNKNINLPKEVNQLVKEYITRALEEGQNGKGHEFKKGIDMILSKEKIQQESHFFNKLYEKHGIDYKL